jgi:hypothetical protein
MTLVQLIGGELRGSAWITPLGGEQFDHMIDLTHLTPIEWDLDSEHDRGLLLGWYRHDSITTHSGQEQNHHQPSEAHA